MALKEFHRVLKPGGTARISVPDFEVVCRLFLDPHHSQQDRDYLMQVAYGGQEDAHDFHHVGLTFELLSELLGYAGFGAVERVRDFGLFHDGSRQKYNGVPLSRNLVARK